MEINSFKKGFISVIEKLFPYGASVFVVGGLVSTTSVSVNVLVGVDVSVGSAVNVREGVGVIVSVGVMV